VDFGFGLNGDNTLITPANGTIVVQVDTFTYLAGTGQFTECGGSLCQWHISGCGSSGLSFETYGDVSDIEYGQDTVWGPNGMYLANGQNGLFFPEVVPEPSSLLLLISVLPLTMLRLRRRLS
jgi:hypothetical protein